MIDICHMFVSGLKNQVQIMMAEGTNCRLVTKCYVFLRVSKYLMLAVTLTKDYDKNLSIFFKISEIY